MKSPDALKDLVAKFVVREREKQTKYYILNKWEESFNIDNMVWLKSWKL